MNHAERLQEIFSHFPGIGPRQAKRFVYYLQSRSDSTIRELADLMIQVKKSTAECEGCHRFFIGHERSKYSPLCVICSDEGRDRNSLLIISRDSDLENIEKSGAYRGLYFVLGGTVPLMDKEPEKRIRLAALLKKIKTEKFAEIILSLNATPDGENTGQIVHKAIQGTYPELKVTVLGRGLSTGAELEYADADTIANAISNRR